MRCLPRLVMIGIGLIFLFVGATLLYTVYLEEPALQDATLGTLTRLEDATDGDLNVGFNGVIIPSSAAGDAEVDTNQINEALGSRGPDGDGTSGLFDDDMRNLANSVVSAEAMDNTSDPDAIPILVNGVITESTDVEMVDLNTGGIIGTFSIEERVAELEWPEEFREGESGAVRLTLRALEDGGLEAVAEIGDNTVLATPILIRDFYATHTATVRARITAPEFEVENNNSAEQSMLEGQQVEWRWTLTPQDTGTFPITIGVEVLWKPLDASGSEQGPYPIWGQSVQTEVVQVFGLISIPEASIAGTILAVLGALMQFPFFSNIVEAIGERILERIRGENNTSNA